MEGPRQNDVSPISLPSITVDAKGAATRAKPASSFWPSFHEVLSALNPLQYVPVVGTIYRSVTGDTIPDNTRMAGGLVFSGLTGGPVGLATTFATDLLEKVTGFDPERIGRNILASLGLGEKTPDASNPRAEPTKLAQTDMPPSTHARAMTDQELAAYGVQKLPDGSLRKGALEGADVLNTLELSRLGKENVPAHVLAQNAYRKNEGLKLQLKSPSATSPS